MTTNLQVPAAPSLPLGTPTYERSYQDAFSNILRLYFNRLTNAINSLTGVRGGQYLNTPYAAVQRTTNQTFAANTATQITFDQNDFLNGCENPGTDGVLVAQSGIYNYQFSVQLKNTDTQIHSAWIWLRKNGVDVEGTGSKFDVVSSHGGTPGYGIAACNFYVSLTAEDTVEMWAAVDNTAISFEAAAAQTSPFAMPAIPSVVATLSFVSALA